MKVTMLNLGTGGYQVLEAMADLSNRIANARATVGFAANDEGMTGAMAPPLIATRAQFDHENGGKMECPFEFNPVAIVAMWEVEVKDA